MRRCFILFIVVFFSCAAISCGKEEGYESLSYVDPLIGTCGEGTQYGGMMPMAGVPFGSIQWVPMTRLTEVGVLSYNEADTLLLGYIGARQPAIWMGEWGQVSFQPQIGAEPVLEYERRGQVLEEQEYTPYSGRVKAGGIETRYAGSAHAAIYEISAADHLVIDASRICRGKASNPSPLPGHLEFSPDGRSASGWNSDLFDGHHTSPKPNFRGYFYIEFSRPAVRTDVSGDLEDECRGYASFGGRTAPLTVRLGVSLLSVEQARANLSAEIGRKSVRQVSNASRKAWASEFSKLSIDACEEVKTIFYTGLYHALLYPRKIDEGGRYWSAFDDKVHEGNMYTCWSMWDTYRAEHPLLCLLVPERIDEMMQSLIEMYHEGGWLPKWPNPGYTGIMIGSPAETILAQAWAEGFRGFDLQEAYAAVKKNATVPQEGDTTCMWKDRGCFGDTPETRGGLTRYQTIGYVAGDETRESVSRTQDFGLQDLAAAILADAAGYPDDAAYFRGRSFNYRNLWNADRQLFLAKTVSGEWIKPSYRDFCECKESTALWCVPYDVDGLAELMGGCDAFESRLDEFFEKYFWVPERGNKSLHGNEPSHHIAYLYNRIGRPEKTQARVREILSCSYSTERKGFDGNEDCGQMSAWYIMSSLGLYMLNPADGWYEIGAPCVREATLKTGNPYEPVELHIVVKNLSPDITRLKSVTFNGRPLDDWRIHHDELIRGGELCFEY
ncbi:MAG: GH92 family glycosyl hydrolase [Bacteroidales bacterium]|nr:GH92 family glycosyl hydrolase [Bacteroidales bacterium]